jgi:RPA family protein
MSGAAPTREVAYRLFADEFAQSTFSYAESDDDRAPQYLVAPTGARMNRVFVVGVLTETEEVSDGVLRARIVDPTGAFVCYAGQYQPDALAFFERAEPPTFVALTAKARTFEPEGADRVFTSLRPEQVNEVTAGTRDSWIVETAEQSLERAALTAQALSMPERGEDLRARLADAGLEPGLAAGIPQAIAEYDVTTDYLAAVQTMALEAVEIVTGDRENVESLAGAPSEADPGEVMADFASLTLAPSATAGGSAIGEQDEGSEIEQEDTPAAPGEPNGSDTTADAIDAAEADASEDDAAGVEEPISGSDRTDEVEATATGSGTAPAEEVESQANEATDAFSDGAAHSPDGATDSEEIDEPVEIDETAEDTETTPADSLDAETPADAGSAPEAAAEADADGTEEDELYELSDEERAEVEENFDVGFESGAEIGSPEETPDIEPEAEPDPEAGEERNDAAAAAVDEEAIDATTGETTVEETEEGTSAAVQTEDGEDTAGGDAEPTETPVEEEPTVAETDPEQDAVASEDEPSVDDESDPEELVVATLRELGDGESVPRSDLVAAVEDRHDLSAAEIEDAIQAALLGGRCFESGADALKPI